MNLDENKKKEENNLQYRVILFLLEYLYVEEL